MMCEAGEVNSNDVVLEIGPGKGALTAKLLDKAGKVIAVEKDNELFEFLKEKFSEEIKNKKLELVNGDILNFDPATYYLLPATYKVIANIPYNITGSILKNFLASDIQPSKMVLLVQKEVAERIVARDEKESILSLSIRAYGTPKYIMKVHKRFFSPSPKVDSAIIAINDISKQNFHIKNEENMFFEVVKTGFAHKRKVLRKNLEIIEKKPGQIDEIFKKLKIDEKSRAENIKFEKWLQISSLLSTEI